ncbi:MAG: hypothetical protein ACR65W_07465 [Methylocystis sp.]|uniref:hypothetical protein n=1 Tax=Methylocystis sp. TaxID=1911079 RepID=UPI003DA3E921
MLTSPGPPNLSTVAAPPGWTVVVNGVPVPMIGMMVQTDEYNLGDLRGITLNGIAPAGAEMIPPGGEARNITGVAAAGGSNVSEVTITVTDENGDAVAAVHHLDVWLSDAASGAGLTGTTASGTVTNKSASGTVLQIYSAKKAVRVQTLATGIFILEITDTAKTAFKVCATLNGKAVVLATLTAGNYGA